MVTSILIVLGLCFGSFVKALTWRLKTKRDWVRERSVCVHCNHVLAAKDLVPVLSWLWLRGRCCYCGQPISWQYPTVEVVTALLFVLSYLYWPYGWQAQGISVFVIWLIFLVGFMALIIYDLRWMILPDKVIFPLLGLVSIWVMLQIIAFHGGFEALAAAFWGWLVLGGLFYVMFQLSAGKWIGGGDVKLGMMLGLLVGGPLKAIIILFLASLLGSVGSLPLLLTGRIKNRRSHVPFGPFLILATIIVYLFGNSLIHWYKRKVGIL